MTDTISVKRDGQVWYGADLGTPGKWAWKPIGWVHREGRDWVAYQPVSRDKTRVVANHCPTRHEAVMALRWPDDVPEAYR